MIVGTSLFSDDMDVEDAGFIPLISDGEEPMDLKDSDIENLPLLPLRNVVLFPEVILPVSMGRKKSLLAVKNAYKNKSLVAVFTQRDAKIEEPIQEELFEVGTVATVIKILELPDGSTTAILQGKHRVHLDYINSVKPFYRGTVSPLSDVQPEKSKKKEVDALLEAVKDTASKIIKGSGNMPPEAMFAIKNIEQPMALLNFACANLGLSVEEKQILLEIDEVEQKGYKLLEFLNKELQMIEIKQSIQHKTHEGIDQQQREYFLQQQIKTIQDELGDSQSKYVEDLREKAKKKKWTKEVKEIFDNELSKLDRMSQHSPDYSVQLGYLETIVALPWNEYTKDSLNLKNVKKILDRDHFGMEKVKERIIEHLAVLKMKNDMKSPIICLVGPPGVGKTSLGKSIAESLNRKYVRVSLGGLHDEAEIRGHRRTYIGAMPGRIIQGIQKSGSANPVFVLDEIDKVNHDFKGDPESALLEVLDPEQNNAFHDNFLDIDFDLSKVMFIATANDLSTISKPLLDRMEIIEVGGYIQEEKVRIALDHLLPKERENHGLKEDQITLTEESVDKIIDGYTRESGVRELDKQICKIMRKVAYKIAMKEEYEPVLNPDHIEDFLGTVRFSRDKYQGNEYAGVVTGLAWTSVGGEILFVESSLSKSKTPKLTLTGSLGDVMKESAIIALEYVRVHADYWNIDSSVFDEYSIHVHVPEGAVPKDGPSAGVTMVTSLVSALTKRKVRKNLAMTGEITLRGKVLPVGGIREKILAAKRAGITDIILCKENEKDILEIKPAYLKGVTFHYVEDIRQVTDFALLDELAE
ncbi:MAG: endopeptidase La [Paludibacteraceae bacterium]|nr:endopeptidase La [Paludibacteraceae bacterium]MBR2262241.1 endopeptidase La [Paludibacteraceae bacterium]MEE3485246.1 endopeptidase La [Bacteroidales bacterium]